MKDLLIKYIDNRGIFYLTLNRPDIMNAFDDVLISELDKTFSEINDNEKIRAMVLTGAGKAFSAGADLDWMRRMSKVSHEKNMEDAKRLSLMLQKLDKLAIPTIAKVNGAAYGGGVGLVAACDIAIGGENAKFCLSEVRLGLIPAVISPYLVRSVGSRNARYLFLTSIPISSKQAVSMGLINESLENNEIDDCLEKILLAILKGGRNAQAMSKDLIFAVEGKEINKNVLDDTAKRIADARASEEGIEGIEAFLNKRAPNWQK